jgi:peptidoglycan/LPS O-acetylase OafA/YrhL
LAALSILTWHVWVHSTPDSESFDLGAVERYLFPQLALGVTLLLLLSGFLLYRPFAAAIIRGTDRPSLARYLVNRGWRIFPAYWVILLVTVFVFQTSNVRTDGGGLEPARLSDPWLLLLNFFLLQGFVPDGVLTGIGPAWALTAVVTFYAVLPLLVLLAAALAARAQSRRGRVLAALAPAAGLVLLGLAGKATAAFLIPPGPSGGWGDDWHSVVERSFFGHADMFGFGLAVAVIHVQRRDGRLRLPRRWRIGALAAMLAVALPTTKIFGTEADFRSEAASNFTYDTVMAAVGGLFLLYVLLPDPESSHPWLLVRLLEARLIVAVGVVSYSLFLWHEPLILLLREHGYTFAGAGGFLSNELLVACLALALSIVTYHYLERPALLRKAQSQSPERPAPWPQSGGKVVRLLRTFLRAAHPSPARPLLDREKIGHSGDIGVLGTGTPEAAGVSESAPPARAVHAPRS